MWEVDWYVVQKMIIDSPQYDTEENIETTPKAKEINFKEQTSEDLLDLFEKHLK